MCAPRALGFLPTRVLVLYRGDDRFQAYSTKNRPVFCPGCSFGEPQDLENLVIHLCGDLKTKDSAQPVPLTRLACEVLQEWRKGQTRQSPFVFPSPYNLQEPIGTVKTAWKATLRRAGVSHFPIYNLRHVFCTRLSWVAPDAVVQHAMRHSSPETKRFYQLGLAHQVREHLQRVNEKTYEEHVPLQIRDSGTRPEQVQQMVVSK